MQTASAQFSKLGYGKVTIDEIAAALGISKKTIYKYFAGKEELYNETARMHLAEIKEKFDALVNDKRLAFPEKLAKGIRIVAAKLLEVGAFLKDNAATLPGSHARIMRLRGEIVIGFFTKLFREGVRLGFVRQSIKEDAFLLILITLLQNLFTPDVLARSPFSPLEMFQTVARILLEGLLEKTRGGMDKMISNLDKGDHWDAT
jgi:AcrR family transcriptional regulator